MSNIRSVIEYYCGDINSSNKACCALHGEATPSLHVYDESESWHCFGSCGEGGDAIEFVRKAEDCGFKEAVVKLAEILNVEEVEVRTMLETKKQTVVDAPVMGYPAMDKDELREFMSAKTYNSNDYRSIPDEVSKFFGHMNDVDQSGKVTARYYPETNDDGKVCGWKCRNHPKDFSYGKVGHTGGRSQLSGQVKFKNGGKYVLIVGGEEDKAAAYAMLASSRAEGVDGVAVVSPTSGESSAAKQCARQYEWLDKYEVIVIGMDNDAAGRKAAEEIAKVLPKEKVRIATWSSKDPNLMLQENKTKQFIRDFYAAKPMVESGVKDSSGMMDAMKQELLAPKIPLPPHMHKLQEAMGGGIRQGRIVNVIGDTSTGKSSHVNAMVYHWAFNAPETICVVSLEATEGQYALDIASLHLERNLTWYEDGQDIIDYIEQPEVTSLLDNLMFKENGQPRYYIIDERDGSIEILEKQMERMYRQHGCKIFIIDVLTDILRGSNETKQEDHMKWQKQFIKNGVTIINVLHTRKPAMNSEGKLRKVTEYDALGSGTFVQSAAINIVINRDKMAGGIEQNTTYVDMPKCRGGKTGEICKWFYDFKTRKIWDLDEYLEQHPEHLAPQEPDIDF
ncbi:MAG: putative ATP-dependent helicase [Prokaryotic dsDNA virus sp.]|nr:MAG: putative ATP-dependent helicase [Prokaryotic dsDNA virus sp.]